MAFMQLLVFLAAFSVTIASSSFLEVQKPSDVQNMWPLPEDFPSSEENQKRDKSALSSYWFLCEAWEKLDMKCEKSNQDPTFDVSFPEQDVTDFVKPTSVLPSLTTFTICLWWRSDLNDREMYFFNYKTTDRYSEIGLKYLNRKIHANVDVFNQFRYNVNQSSGEWHHTCLSWHNNGTGKLYHDGKKVKEESDIAKEKQVAANGEFVLGQVHGYKSGHGFRTDASYTGDLSQLNMWDHVLTDNKISRMSQACTSEAGNVLKWSDFRSGVKGNAEVVEPSTCKPSA